MIGMPKPFDAATLGMLDRVREVELETTANDGATIHRTIIWVVVVGESAFIRSEYAEAGRWYREARARPDVVLHAEAQAIPVNAVLVSDATTIGQVSDAYRQKYGKRSAASTEAMVAPHTLEHTLRLDPRDAAA
jgi:hypothetical protein